MQVIFADSTFECSQSGLDGRPRLSLPHRGDWEQWAPHRITILGSITRSALAILALGRSQK
jgi:hypothetical protein